MPLSRNLEKSSLHSAASFFLILVFAFLGTALTAAYPIQYGIFPALFFSSIPVILIFGLGTMTATPVRWVLDRFSSFTASSKTLIQTYVPALLGFIYLTYGLAVYHDDRFEALIAESRPPSLIVDARDLRRGYGSSEWTYAFRIDPKFTDQLILHHQNELDDLPESEIVRNLETALMHYESAPIPQAYHEPSRLQYLHRPSKYSEYSTGFSLWVFSSPASGYYLVFGSSD